MKVPTLRVFAPLAVLACVMAGPACAQVSTSLVHWQLDVIQNGETVDTFKADTPLGQTQTETREHEATHVVGCAEKPAAHIVLTRSIAVTPSLVPSPASSSTSSPASSSTSSRASSPSDEHGVSFMIDATEMLEDAAAQRTNEGCTLPPQPRVVHATHPALVVGASGWTDWPVVAHDPVLVYRLQASIDKAGAPVSSQGRAPAGAASGAAVSTGNAPDAGVPDVTVPDDSAASH
jgi:hypothetical protein